MSFDKYDNRIDFDNYNGKFWYKKIKNYLDILYLKEQLGLIKLNNSLSKINLFLRIRLKIILKNLKLYN